MFEDWKKAWKEAVENFRRELEGGTDDGEPAARYRAMENGLQSARDALTRLDGAIEATRRDAAAERESERVCRRREELATGVGDEETVRLAREYAERHAERAEVLERKVSVLADERALMARDVASMENAFAAQPAPSVGNSQTRETLEERERSDRDFRRLDREAREKMADQRLEELKRKLR